MKGAGDGGNGGEGNESKMGREEAAIDTSAAF